MSDQSQGEKDTPRRSTGKPDNDPLEGARPESRMMGHAYNPRWSEGSIKPPIFQTSTFAFESAEEGKEFFSYAYGLAERDPARPMGLIYSRLNNPNLEILEERLNLWDRAEASAVFASGMAAISTSLLALVPCGSSVVFSRPVYGGTDFLLEHVLPERQVETREFLAGADGDTVEKILQQLADEGHPCKVLFIETPANPTLRLTDIEEMAEIAHRHHALCAVDNTFLGPLYQQPLALGADLVLSSATKYLGGHSDLVAGVALGRKDLIEQIKGLRTILGNMLEPFSAWLLLRSLETAKLRMTCSRKNAEKIVPWLARHPKVARVHFPGFDSGANGRERENGGETGGDDESEDRQREIYDKQCTGPGALLAFELKEATEEAAFRFLNATKLIKLAVSLGANESLVEHPASMTHSDVPPDEQRAIGIHPGLIRIAVGIEHPNDLIADLERALEAV